MNMGDVLNGILKIIPHAKCCVWNALDGYYGGETEPVRYENFLIDWSPLNEMPCPPWNEIKAAIDTQ